MPKITSDYIEVHICLSANNEYKFLLLKRSETTKVYPGIWQMVTGKIEEGESTSDAVKRELFEETGIKAEKLYVIPKINTFYFAASDRIMLSPVFLVMVKNTDVIISDEHCEYKWVSYEEAAGLIYWPNQVESLSIIMRQLRHSELFEKLPEIK